MYNANNYMYSPSNTSSYREIRKRESENYRDAKARRMIEEMKKQRKGINKPASREPILVCRRMNRLPDSPL